MKFNTLKEKCEYFRGLSDYRLVPNSYMIVMLDGRSFSKMVKKKYKLPFDEKFMDYMNKTAVALCNEIQGAKFAYVQSDEISILVTDFDTPETDACFGYRLCKMQSIFASIASNTFNKLALADAVDEISTLGNGVNASDLIRDFKMVQFDCKCWTVPSANDAFCHFLWRQNDCVRNSKQQAAQTYLPHKELVGKNTDEQVRLLRVTKGYDWELFTAGEKYGRLIYKEEEQYSTVIKRNRADGSLEETPITYTRNTFKPHGASLFGAENNIIHSLIPSRISTKTTENDEN